MIGMLLEKIRQDGLRLFLRAFQCINPREIQICLIERRSNPDALLETRNRFIAAFGHQIEHSQIVERFGINRAGLQCPLKMFVGILRIFRLRENHAETVVCFRVVGSHFQSKRQDFAGIVPAFLQPIGVAQIIESKQMARTEFQGLLKV